ncbi:MAG: OmpH family outer membrane protein [Bacteroidia bacterium]|nr:MAG: OmpH family outer membrane protein [Bacteroidia bacterium]
MKKLPLILSIVSLIAVATLLVFEFTEKEESESLNQVSVDRGPSAGIAYVEVDSVIFNFQYFFELRDELLVKQQSAEAKLNSNGRAYETQARDYEDKVRKGLVTRATAAEMEQNLLQQQQELVNLRDQLQNDLMEEEQVMNRKVLQYIYDFLQEYTKENNFDYILGKSFGGQVLYGDSNLDITDDVLTRINEKYIASKK